MKINYEAKPLTRESFEAAAQRMLDDSRTRCTLCGGQGGRVCVSTDPEPPYDVTGGTWSECRVCGGTGKTAGKAEGC